MLHIALVCEGKTDKPVLKNILKSFFEIDKTIKVPELQPSTPPWDVDGGSEEGGWRILKRYLGTTEFTKALNKYSYVIVQLDSDVCEEIGFDCPPNFFANCSIEEFYVGVKAKVESWIDRQVQGTYAKYQHKIIFAICIHSTEYWLLVHHYPSEIGQKYNSFDRINAKFTVDNKKKLYKKGIRTDRYREHSAGFADIEVLKSLVGRSFSLDLFLMQLACVKSNTP